MRHSLEIIPSGRRFMNITAERHTGGPPRPACSRMAPFFVAFAALAMAHGALAASGAEAAPDLTVVGLFVALSGGGNSVNATDTTRNVGDVEALPTTVRFYLSSDPVLDGGDLALGSREVPALGPGAVSSAVT